MPNWFKAGPSPHQTALAMIGAKAGDRVLVIGADDPDLAAAVALVTGLNGRTLVVDSRADRAAAVEAAAGKAGALVDFLQASGLETGVEAPRFDVSVVATPLVPVPDVHRTAIVATAVGALRAGGRVVVIDGRKAAGLLAGFARSAPRLDPAIVLSLLERAGLRATRQLADSEGVAFYEGRT